MDGTVDNKSTVALVDIVAKIVKEFSIIQALTTRVAMVASTSVIRTGRDWRHHAQTGTSRLGHLQTSTLVDLPSEILVHLPESKTGLSDLPEADLRSPSLSHPGMIMSGPLETRSIRRERRMFHLFMTDLIWSVNNLIGHLKSKAHPIAGKNQQDQRGMIEDLILPGRHRLQEQRMLV
jgi:hypothetical protein